MSVPGFTTQPLDSQPLAPMGVNWIGLYTIVRRDVQRMLRVPIQVFIAPWSSALLFIFVFGYVLGGTMRTVGGHKYIEFVMPGVLMMNIINAAFLQSSSAIYFSRFIRFVEEMLVAPLSYMEMVVGSLSTVVLRATFTGIGILIIGLAFGATTIESWPMFIFWIVAVSVIFGLAGILIGLWSKNFEQLNMPVVFFLTPLSMLGGSFFTMKMLPDWLHWLLWANPFFYFINGIRGAMIGVDEAPQGLFHIFDDVERDAVARLPHLVQELVVQRRALRDERAHGDVLQHADGDVRRDRVVVDDAAEHVWLRRAGREVRHEVADYAAEELVLVLGRELPKVLGGDADADDPVDEVGEAERGEACRAGEVAVDPLDDLAVAPGVGFCPGDERLDALYILVSERRAAGDVHPRAVPDVVEITVNEITRYDFEYRDDLRVLARVSFRGHLIAGTAAALMLQTRRQKTVY
jgi:ABC-2 type transport system permease protein